ncbi:MAG: sugar phosphate isomerase/epimerase family protein [Spirochaetales bacterium]
MKKSAKSSNWMTGIADESDSDIEAQLANHRNLGWKDIEIRNVGGKNICEMSDADFDQVRAAVVETGFSVVSFGSAIANWARPITTPFPKDIDDLRRAAPRMRKLGTSYLRIMSYPNDRLTEAEWKAETFRRMNELVTIAEGEGIVLVHENCDGWASASPENLGELLSKIDSPALRVVFDTGNPVSHGGDIELTTRFFEVALPYIVHFHIKDCVRSSSGIVHTYPGEGECGVENFARELISRGYEGLFSIEPHMASQIHLGGAAVPGLDQRGIYLEYGRKAWELVLRAMS